jgi:class 3 adenylate cyclase
MDERVLEKVRRDGLKRSLKEVFISCYDQIIERRIQTVAELLEWMKSLGWDPALETIVRRCYRLIQELHWGMFRDFNREQHPDLWRALTIPIRGMPDVADLKQNVLVPNVYCGLMDIHAYTEFCQRYRHNFSMLRTLDELIQNDVKAVAEKWGCLSCRSAGDAIIVIGSSPGNIIRACLGIIDSFSRKRVLQAAMLSESRKGNAIAMQDFHISAGIAGGLHYSSLVVTADGDISGSVVNTAARLQSFAGTISPHHSKIMVTSHVHAGYLKEQSKKKKPQPDGFAFFGCGKIRFKGTGVSVYELLYSEREMHKQRYQERYSHLLDSIGKGLWTDRLISEATRLVVDVLSAVPVSRVEVDKESTPKALTNSGIIQLCENTLSLYESGRDHRSVSRRLQYLVSILESASGFDPLVLAHFKQIVTVYDQMTRDFETLQYEKILENQHGLFSMAERSAIDHAAKLERIRDALIERGKQQNNLYSSAMLWKKVVSEHEGKWEFEIYSGKQ